MGCTQPIGTTESVTSQPTTAPVLTVVTPTVTLPTATPTIPVTVEPTEEPEPAFEAIEPEWTEVPVIIPIANPDIHNQNFSQFVSDDFMATYPESWAIVCQTFTLDDTTLYGMDIWKTEGRMVTFTSEDGKTKMMVSARDFINPGSGRYNTVTPTIDSARKSVAALFPNASSETSVYNWEYRKNGQMVFTSKYDVIFIPDSEYYPYTYTQETWTTYNHMFTVDFSVMNGKTLIDYKELRDYMMKSIMTEGTQNRKWW